MELIEEVSSQGIWTWLEFDNNSNSLYVEFKNLKLADVAISNPFEYKDDLVIRFGNNLFLSLFYNNVENLEEADIRLVALIGEQLFLKLNIKELELEKWFSPKQISDIRVYYKMTEDDSIEFPYTIENVTELGHGGFVFPIDYKVIARLYNSKKLNYNYDIQRQPKIVKRKDNVVRKPYVNHKSVKEITNHLLNGTLVPTNIVYNAHLGSSLGVEEITYDRKERTLTINEGTRLDILDGMHRTLSSVETYSKNKNIDFNFIGLIFNFSTKEAQSYQSQQAKANPIPKSRIQELEANRYADIVVQQLRIDSELKGRITSRDKIGKGTNELVSYGVLSNAIDSTFELKNKLEALELAKYLSEYFTYLFGYYQSEFEDLEKGNLLFYNKMFIGHMILAKRMQHENIPLSNLKHILKNIDFNKNSKILMDYEIVSDGKIATKIERAITKLFNDIDISDKG